MKKTLFKDNSLEVYMENKNTLGYIYKGKLKRQNAYLKEGSISVNKDCWFSYGIIVSDKNPSKAEMIYIDVVNPESENLDRQIIPILDDKITRKVIFSIINSLSYVCATLNAGLYSYYHKKVK